MAYTPTGPRSKIAPNNFGGLRSDGNRVSMTGALGNTIATQDATATPITSPTTVTTTSTLLVPVNAVQCSIVSTTNNVQISEDSTQSTFFAIPAGQIYTIDCANMTQIYLKVASSTVVNFVFKLI